MQVTITVNSLHANALGLNLHRGTRSILLKVIASLYLILLSFQRFLLAIHLCQLSYKVNETLGRLIQSRHNVFHLLVNLGNITNAHTSQESIVLIQFILFIEQFRHLLETVVHILLLGRHLFLQIIALGFEFLHHSLNLSLAFLCRNGCLEIQTLIGMDTNATFACRYRNLREGVLGIATMKGNFTGL